MSDTKRHKEERKFLAGILPLDKVSMCLLKKWHRYNNDQGRRKKERIEKRIDMLKKDLKEQLELE